MARFATLLHEVRIIFEACLLEQAHLNILVHALFQLSNHFCHVVPHNSLGCVRVCAEEKRRSHGEKDEDRGSKRLKSETNDPPRRFTEDKSDWKGSRDADRDPKQSSTRDRDRWALHFVLPVYCQLDLSMQNMLLHPDFTSDVVESRF
jgi:hypothetical protein